MSHVKPYKPAKLPEKIEIDDRVYEEDPLWPEETYVSRYFLRPLAVLIITAISVAVGYCSGKSIN